MTQYGSAPRGLGDILGHTCTLPNFVLINLQTMAIRTGEGGKGGGRVKSTANTWWTFKTHYHIESKDDTSDQKSECSHPFSWSRYSLAPGSFQAALQIYRGSLKNTKIQLHAKNSEKLDIF